MYLEFTHSQTFETFTRCHIHAFQFFSGTSREIWFDNLATAVAEHEGNLVRFNPRFLAFARECGFVPRACHVAAAWEKGKVERAISYVRQNFWPLRSFTDLADVNAQARQWLKDVANPRRHRETGQTPDERFQPEALRPLSAMLPDYRDVTEALVHKDLRLSFDGNRYCVPARYVGEKLTVTLEGPQEVAPAPAFIERFEPRICRWAIRDSRHSDQKRTDQRAHRPLAYTRFPISP